MDRTVTEMEGSTLSEKWTRAIIASLCIVAVLSQWSLSGSVTEAESTGWGSRGPSESTWTQTTQMDFENGTSIDVIITSSGEVKLGLVTKLIDDDFTDESKISHRENVTVDTAAGEVRLQEVPDLLINKTFGGSEWDYGHAVQLTSDGGYVIAGSTGSCGACNGDAWLIKTDGLGNEEWNKTFGTNESDYGISVQQTLDNGFIIVGSTSSYGVGDVDVWLIRTDNLGNEQWNRTFGGSEGDYGMSVQQTLDSGYIVVGITNSSGTGNPDLWLIKTDSSGNEEWNKTFGGSQWDVGLTVQQTSNGGYIIAGDTKSYGAGDSDVWLIKTDSSGNEQWNRTFGTNESDYGMSVQQTLDSGYIVAGSTNSSGTGNPDLWLIKTDSSGNEEWNKTFGGYNRDEGQTVQQTSDNGFIIAGATSSYGAGEMDVWLIKTDSSGNEEWNKTFGGNRWDVSSFHYFGHAVHQISDDEYTIIGSTESYGAGDWDIWLIKVNASGNPRGSVVSTNLLSGGNAYSIDVFDSTTIIPAGSAIKVQFSQDSLAWYDSNDNLDQWETLHDGFNSVDLSGLGWQGSDFYYRMDFTSDTADVPVLQNIMILYSQNLPSGILVSEPFDSGTYPTWMTLNWSALQPLGTELMFQLRSARTHEDLANETFVGPDGSPVTFYTVSGQSICECHERDRWLQYKAFFSTTDPSTAPVLEEVSITFEPIDTDGDGVSDFEDLDDDNDGLPDSWESQFGFNPLNHSDASTDPDFDTLKNLQEFRNETNPYDNDTDGDGLGDGFEIAFSNTNPTVWDTNGDGVGDGLEFVQNEAYLGVMESLSDDWIGMSFAWESHVVHARTNSSVMDGGFEREQQRLRIRVYGPDGTRATTEIDIPRDLCAPEDIEIRLDGDKIDYSLVQSPTHYIVRVRYTHSIHEITADFGRGVSVPIKISDLMGYLMASTAATITLLVSIAVIRHRNERDNIRVQELPPEKLSMLLEKKHSEGKVTKETYDDIKSLLKKYGRDGKGE